MIAIIADSHLVDRFNQFLAFRYSQLLNGNIYMLVCDVEEAHSGAYHITEPGFEAIPRLLHTTEGIHPTGALP